MPRNFQLHLRPKLFRCNSIGRFNEILPTLLKRYDCTRFNGSIEFNLSERKLVFDNPFAKIPQDCSTLSLLRVNALLSEITFSSLFFICIFSILFCNFILSKNCSFEISLLSVFGRFLAGRLARLKHFSRGICCYLESCLLWNYLTLKFLKLGFCFGFTKILRWLISWFEIFRNFLSSQLSTLKFLYLASFLSENHVISKFLKIWDFFYFKKTSRRAITWLEIFCSGISLFTNVLALVAFHSKTLILKFCKISSSKFKGGSIANFILSSISKVTFFNRITKYRSLPCFSFSF